MTVLMTSSNKKDMARYHRSPRTQEQFQRLDRLLAHTFVRNLIRQRVLSFQQSSRSSSEKVYTPRMDMFDDADDPFVSVVLELPGLKQEDISVRTENNHLVVQGERRFPVLLQHNVGGDNSALARTSSEAVAPTHYKVQELKYGKYKREIPLPSGIQAGDIQASLSDGMLMLSWPRCASATLEYPEPNAAEAIASEPATAAATVD
ncbi:hypothetical protein SCP_0506510 [Sparassis crispa]|uniref:SHSP domain-containing protein n=1 Tax=Sparassis crispa TaxID=139825 RepID=A0A401GN05_9APHY|nr:hypothetical protein SCP_0506510 [Sparassis crispa]GBE83596.1 hypothetical protein SCP_0506510 [Sparassis crispa]